MRAIHEGYRRPRGEVHRQLDAVAEQTLDARGHGAHELSHIDPFGPEQLLSAEGEQLLRQSRRTVRRTTDLDDVGQVRVGTLHGHQQCLGIAGDDRQEVVEIVRDSAGQPADRLERLVLTNTLHLLSAGGDVDTEAAKTRTSLLRRHGPHRGANPDDSSIGGDHPMLDLVNVRLASGVPPHRSAFLHVVWVRLRAPEVRVIQPLCPWITENVFASGADVQKPEGVGISLPDNSAKRFDER